MRDSSFRHCLATLCALGMTTFPALAGNGASTPDTNSKRVAKTLDKLWPSRPDAVDMLVDILIKGEQMGGGDGWFRRCPTQSRFDWVATRGALDKDADGKISRSEFRGSDSDFAQLDRDHNGSLNVEDFDFTPKSTPSSSGSLLFTRADLDGNGKVTREEFAAFFRKNDAGKEGFLSLSDLQNALSPSTGNSGGPPDRSTLLKSFLRGELGAFPSGPSLNDPAPDFTLAQAEGGEAIALSKLVGPKPIVLICGSLTCSPFRAQAGNLDKLYARYKDRATFLMVCVREPHPIEGWRIDFNDRVGISVRQPRNYEERVGVARMCSQRLKLGFPLLVDTMDDRVTNAYSGIPSRLYLIDAQGKIAFKNGRGPFGFYLAELEHALVLLLQPSAESPERGFARRAVTATTKVSP
jgi:Iodothyronine deiodinase/EF-hand domain pair/EF hand